jgi:hypothetical protein
VAAGREWAGVGVTAHSFRLSHSLVEGRGCRRRLSWYWASTGARECGGIQRYLEPV